MDAGGVESGSRGGSTSAAARWRSTPTWGTCPLSRRCRPTGRIRRPTRTPAGSTWGARGRPRGPAPSSGTPPKRSTTGSSRRGYEGSCSSVQRHVREWRLPARRGHRRRLPRARVGARHRAGGLRQLRGGGRRGEAAPQAARRMPSALQRALRRRPACPSAPSACARAAEVFRDGSDAPRASSCSTTPPGEAAACAARSRSHSCSRCFRAHYRMGSRCNPYSGNERVGRERRGLHQEKPARARPGRLDRRAERAAPGWMRQAERRLARDAPTDPQALSEDLAAMLALPSTPSTPCAGSVPLGQSAAW